LLVALVVVTGAGADPGGILSNEDIVRLLVAGATTEQLIERIRDSEVDFDLSPEMLDELGYAGVPAEVIRAMRERQAELEPAPLPDADSESTAEQAGTARLIVTLGPLVAGEAGASATIRAPEPVSPGMIDALGLDPSATDSVKVTDLALFLICRTQDHVPDHWRNQSPLGRDFVNMPRHRMLHFTPGATREDVASRKSPGFPVLALELPKRFEVEIEPGLLHDLSLGIAMQIGGRYYRLHADEWEGLQVDGGDLEIRVQAGNAPGPGVGSVELRVDR